MGSIGPTGYRGCIVIINKKMEATCMVKVTPELLWDGLQKTRHESDTVERGRTCKHM